MNPELERLRSRFHNPNALVTLEEIEAVERMMMKDLAKAPEELFWYWISERHAIYLRRQRGDSKPWTVDPILQQYKFTNPFRENDRGTVWLRENFLEPHRYSKHELFCLALDDSEGIRPDDCSCGAYQQNLSLLSFNICWYRMFNWWGTGKNLGWRTSWPSESIKEILRIELRNGRQVFTGAHIVYSPPGLSKIDAIVNVCCNLWNLCTVGIHHHGMFVKLYDIARMSRSLEETYEALRTIDCVGGFMAYEMVTDMRHTRLLEDATDIMTWANLGPGAKRGLRRLGLPCTPDKRGIESMQQLLVRGNDRYYTSQGVNPPVEPRIPIDYPRLEMRDIEHSLCEFDKYCRVKFGEGEPRGKFAGV